MKALHKAESDGFVNLIKNLESQKPFRYFPDNLRIQKKV